MSADNWAICPKCVENAERKASRALKNAERQYGKVDAGKYMELIEEARTLAKYDVEELRTLREDYEIGVVFDAFSDAEFYVSYRGKCSVCGFSHEFKHSNQV